MDLTSAPLDPGELTQAYPTIQAYQHIMKCKALGLTLDASQFDVTTIDKVYAFYSKVHEVEMNKTRRKK